MRAILVVDVNMGFGWRSEKDVLSEEQQKFISDLKMLLERNRANGTKIIFVIWPEGRFSGQEFFVQPSSWFGLSRCVPCKNGEMADFLDHRHEKGGYEPVFLKYEADAFSNKNLATHLRKEGVTEVALVGRATDCCVLSTAIGARAAGFDVMVLKHCVWPPFLSEQDLERWILVVKRSADSSLKVTAE